MPGCGITLRPGDLGAAAPPIPTPPEGAPDFGAVPLTLLYKVTGGSADASPPFTTGQPVSTIPWPDLTNGSASQAVLESAQDDRELVLAWCFLINDLFVTGFDAGLDAKWIQTKGEGDDWTIILTAFSIIFNAQQQVFDDDWRAGGSSAADVMTLILWISGWFAIVNDLVALMASGAHSAGRFCEGSHDIDLSGNHTGRLRSGNRRRTRD